MLEEKLNELILAINNLAKVLDCTPGGITVSKPEGEAVKTVTAEVVTEAVEKPKKAKKKVEEPVKVVEETKTEALLEDEDISAEEMNLDDIRSLCKQIITQEEGKDDKPKKVVASFGAAKLSELKEEDYPKVVKALKALLV